MNEIDRRYHEVANIFPLMQGEEFEALKADIAEHGQREPIWLHQDGSIIDGRNRHHACCELDITPKFHTWDGKGSLVAFVVSLNLHRRHLTSGQKAIIAVDILHLLEAEAKERKLATLKQNQTETVPQRIGERTESVHACVVGEPREGIRLYDSPKTKNHNGEATAEAAKLTGTNRQYVSDAKKLVEQAPEVAAKVRSGELTITQAKREIVKMTISEPPSLPTGKYRVIYADPPWKYGNTQPDYQTEQADYYSLMTIREICDMPIKDLAEDNAVLFLWVTSPILEESFQVVNAWGFRYKSSFIWDKIKHNMGHYNSVRHEILLVCVRGSCQPDVQKLFDSVQSIERTAHSEKPEFFREIIDTIYPKGARIELFARKQADGWTSYGNQLPG